MRFPGHKSFRRKQRPRRGIRLPRKRKFEPVLPTSGGIRVRSRYEQVCVEFFDNHQIQFIYEPLLLLEGQQYRPDFFLPDFGLFVEICGYIHMPFYNDRVAKKQALYDKHHIKSLFITYNGRGSLAELLTRRLGEVGIVID